MIDSGGFGLPGWTVYIASNNNSAFDVGEPSAVTDASGGLPLLKPPYGQISAIDLKTGTILWQTPHGDTADNIKNNPALKGVNIGKTGRAGAAITLVTKTLVIAGEKGTVTMADGRVGAMMRDASTRL